MYQLEQREQAYKYELAGMLEHLCRILELSETQHERAKGHYEAVGKWLAGAPDIALESVQIYPQGSTSLGTTVKPLNQNEHDVDLVCFLPDIGPDAPPQLVKELIGARLRENGRYAQMLKPMNRCWRLDYAGDFHLDITPSIRNPWCNTGGELVPDRDLRCWKPSNPKGYKAFFEKRAKVQPRLRLVKLSKSFGERRDGLEPFPDRMDKKGILRRAVQLAKRHRDVFFSAEPELAPISVILTTLAAYSYEYCVGREYDTEFDLLADVIANMPCFIHQEVVNGQPAWFIWNETTTEENFAEKWNHNPKLAEAFFRWHRRAAIDLANIADQVGEDLLRKSMAEAFGPEPVKQAFDLRMEEIAAARTNRNLRMTPLLGVTAGASSGVTIQRNTFFGAE